MDKVDAIPKEVTKEARKRLNYRWFVFVIFLLFMLLHQSDRLLIGSLEVPVEKTFNIGVKEWGWINTGALIVGALFYPFWGWASDKWSRSKLLALASFIWGATTWFGAIAPTYPLFLAARSSTGIDDSSYPGLYSLMGDYFEPKKRGLVYGLLQTTQPLGYIIGMALALFLGGVIGWRAVFYITGSLGVVMAAVIFWGVKDAPRGQMEPELEKIENLEGKYKFNWKAVGQIFKSPTMVMIVLQGFFGVFPWNVITYFFIGYLQSAERGNYDSGQVMMTMVPAVLALAAGYPLGGWLGDKLFKRTKRGRVIISTIGVIAGAVFLYFTLMTPINQPALFFVLLLCTAIFIPFASPNVLSTIYDITVPEIRSTTNAVESFIESIGAATAPLITGYIIAGLQDSGVDKPRTTAMLLICVTAWLLCFFFFLFTIFRVPKDIDKMHAELERRGLKDGVAETTRMVG
jgi:MFS transporter, Spinster family, sphingosine-1-phosphate transporter